MKHYTIEPHDQVQLTIDVTARLKCGVRGVTIDGDEVSMRLLGEFRRVLADCAGNSPDDWESPEGFQITARALPIRSLHISDT